MLSHIHIRDFALVESLDLDFRAQMSALTGETGAGKSILLDALGLCLGDRADADAVRAGTERAEITVTFELDGNEEVRQWLEEHDLAVEDECILRRVVQSGGRSKGYVNGTPVPLTLLRELGEQLVDIHGQHAHQSLMRRDVQRQILDDFAAHPSALSEVARLFERYTAAQRELEALEGQQNYEDRLELLRFQVNELDALGLTQEEIVELDAEQKRLASAGDLIQTSQAVLASLYEEEGSAQAVLSHAVAELARLSRLDPNLNESAELFNNALIQLEEGCDSLRRYGEALDLDPERLAWVEQRLTTLNDVARKHRVRPEDLPARLEELRAELDRLEGAEERMAMLRKSLATTEQAYCGAAAELSKQREQAAVELAERATAYIRELGMPGAQLTIAVDHDPSRKPARHGLDQVEFLVRTNPGQAIGPISRIASGGELSRIGLAVQVTTANTSRIGTLVFDEADVGIGGAVAEVVGRQLRTLGEHRQVLCVTHLPQVAAQAHHQYRVSKSSVNEQTRTLVEPLPAEDRVQELARMLGGVEITSHTLNHAREMLERAQTAGA